jgi:hypothetical protein
MPKANSVGISIRWSQSQPHGWRLQLSPRRGLCIIARQLTLGIPETRTAFAEVIRGRFVVSCRVAAVTVQDVALFATVLAAPKVLSGWDVFAH